MIFIFFLTLDLLYSKYLFKPKKYISIYENHNQLHHSLKKNFKGISKFGFLEPFVCTNDYGFKFKCGDKSYKEYDIGILGDSIVQGVGLEYEKTIPGILSEKTNLKIANLGTGSYSPILYYEKILNLLVNNFKFKHIIVFIDISDIHDEYRYYKSGNSIKRIDAEKPFDSEYVDKLNLIFSKKLEFLFLIT